MAGDSVGVSFRVSGACDARVSGANELHRTMTFTAKLIMGHDRTSCSTGAHRIPAIWFAEVVSLDRECRRPQCLRVPARNSEDGHVRISSPVGKTLVTGVP